MPGRPVLHRAGEVRPEILLLERCHGERNQIPNETAIAPKPVKISNRIDHGNSLRNCNARGIYFGLIVVVQITQDLIRFALFGRVRLGHNPLHGALRKIRSGGRKQVHHHLCSPEQK